MPTWLHRSLNLGDSTQICKNVEGGDDPTTTFADRIQSLRTGITRFRGFGLKRSMWRLGTVIASSAVITFALLYVIEPTSSAFTLMARQGGSAPPGSVVLYGSVLNGSTPVPGAQITVSGNNGGKHGHHDNGVGQIVGSVNTDAQGAYRLPLYIQPGTYTVDVSLANGTEPHGFKFQFSDNSSSAEGNSDSGANVGNAYTTDSVSSHHFRSDNRNEGNGNSDHGQTNGHGSDDGYGFPGLSVGRNFAAVTADQILGLVPGLSYDISAELTTTNLLSFLPVSSY